MSDCCKLPAPSPAADGLCRRCGEKARSVLRETMESLLKPEARARLADEPYFFDRTPSCGVVYFSNEAESYFHKDERNCLPLWVDQGDGGVVGSTKD